MSTTCPICDRVRVGQEPDRAIRSHLASQRALSGDPPTPVAVVRDQVSATACAAHGATVQACDDVTILKNTLLCLEVELDIFDHPSALLDEADVPRARARLEARYGRVARLLDR